ncbi:alcohol dehydrogenase catalytic domain-containing protein, partial [Thermodesulfobacteriota bacterium]
MELRAAYVKKKNKVEIRDIPRPIPKEGQVLIKILGCGVCGSDYLEGASWAKNWKRFGHEMAAVVAEVGPEVIGFAPGDHVAVALSVACGACPSCIAGNPRKCTGLITAEQGGFAEYVLITDHRLLFKV